MSQPFSISDLSDYRPSKRKIFYPVNATLRSYLKRYGRDVSMPVYYKDLLQYTFSIPLKDKDGNHTHWEKVMYDSRDWDYISQGLVEIYTILKTEGDTTFVNQLEVARIDYCPFGNSHPFRIRIVNKYNDNYDHYYIKLADSSRIYGLELEHLLSPNRMTFFTSNDTIIEEHIPGIPGDVFINQYLNLPNTNKVRLAKEFVKFNERCFNRLLGDMRSYNFVVSMTPDIEDFQYRLRAIDFDQQSYEGRKKLYMPQFFKENYPFVKLCMDYLNKESIEQYQAEEKTLITFRLASARYRIKELLDCMITDTTSPPEKIIQLKNELNEHFDTHMFDKCTSMGMLLKQQLKYNLQARLQMVRKNFGKRR